MAADPMTSNAVDALLNEDYDSDDPFGDRPTKPSDTRDDKPTLSPRKRKVQDIFALDEEVKITKQRKKIPKLDADRLLSEPGIPKLRSLIRSGQLKKKLKLKGKGHEFSDVARLLNYYQLWMDQLYPRAKFGDAMLMVEKAGHTKRMAIYRKSWIDEGKPGFVRREEVDDAIEHSEQIARVQQPVMSGALEAEDSASMFFGGGTAGEQEDDRNVGPDDDELDALMAQETVSVSRPQVRIQHEDSEGEDDLDALLAEQDTRRPTTTQPPKSTPLLVEDDQDDLDALLELEQSNHKQSPTKDMSDEDELDALLDEDPTPNDSTRTDSQSTEQDELDALLNENEASDQENALPPTTSQPKLPPMRSTAQVPGSEEVPELDEFVSSSPIPNVQTDELDELMDEHDEALKKHSETTVLEAMFSSSPIPNRESQ